MLGNFATVDEVKAAVGDVVVWGETVPQLGSFAPLHYVVHDASGKSIVIEYVDGKLHVYDNTVGVLTNSPTYEWHIQNLRNYVNLTAVNAKPVKIGNVTYAGTGQGSGLHGLPGDPTPPSRFVMAAATAYLADKPKDAAEALIVAEHLINRVDIPKGLVRDYSQGGKPMGDYTQWTTFRDHANKIYYWKTYNDPAHEGGRPQDARLRRRPADALAQHRRRQADGADGDAARLRRPRRSKGAPPQPKPAWDLPAVWPGSAFAIRRFASTFRIVRRRPMAAAGPFAKQEDAMRGFAKAGLIGTALLGAMATTCVRRDQVPGRQPAHPGQLDGDALLPGQASRPGGQRARLQDLVRGHPQQSQPQERALPLPLHAISACR